MNEIFATEFSKELKKIRLRMSCSQVQFCERINVPTGTYSAWETGRFLPSVKSFSNVCSMLKDINVDEFEIVSLKNKYYNLKVAEK